MLFTDIVNSTELHASLGDEGWKPLVGRHHEIVRDALVRWRGVENDTAGDGFYATFDGPARAIRCAQEVIERVRDLGHRGPRRRAYGRGHRDRRQGQRSRGRDRVAGRRSAAPSEILVSQTVKDLTAGSGPSFEAVGECQLKGIAEPWRLHRVLL